MATLNEEKNEWRSQMGKGRNVKTECFFCSQIFRGIRQWDECEKEIDHARQRNLVNILQIYFE